MQSGTIGGPTTAVALAVDLANGYLRPAACPDPSPTSDLTLEQARRLQQKVRLEHDAFTRFVPTSWYEPELAHAVVEFGKNKKIAWSEVVYCRRLIERAGLVGSCLVYIFGTTERDIFTEVFAMRHRSCEIYAFDPTVAPEHFVSSRMADARARMNASAAIHFRPWGLRGGSRSWSHRYYSRVVGELLTLDDIVARLGHAHRRISLLRSDCEGCEWEWLATASPSSGTAATTVGEGADGSILRRIDQLFIELHFATSLRFDALALRTHLPRVHAALSDHFGARVSFANIGGDVDRFRVPRLLVAAGADPLPCCRNYLLVNRRHAQPPRPPSATAIELRMAADLVELPDEATDIALAPSHGHNSTSKGVGGVARIEGNAHSWRRTFPFDGLV